VLALFTKFWLHLRWTLILVHIVRKSNRETIHMIVMKFGSSCLYSAEVLATVSNILKEHLDQKPIIVLSAFINVTNCLIDSGKKARHGTVCIKEIRDIHTEILEKLDLPKKLISDLLNELHSLLTGISLIKELTTKLLDVILSFGERLIVRIFSAYLNRLGVNSIFIDGWDAGIKTTSAFTKAEVLPESYQKIRSRFKDIDDAIPVVTGFIGKDSNGCITTLGRGGGDLTASIIGAALNVKEVQFWKNVDGILSADPRIVKEARHLEEITYTEASELVYFGSKVLHPTSILPTFKAKIPVRIKNHLKPNAPGTSILIKTTTPNRFVGIAHKSKQVLINISSTRMLGQSGFLMKVFEIFNQLEFSVDMIVTSEVSISLTLSDTHDFSVLQKKLESLATITLSRGMAAISLIGNHPPPLY